MCNFVTVVIHSPLDILFWYAPNCTKTSEPPAFYLLDESPSKQRATGIIFTLSWPSLPYPSKSGHDERRSGRVSAYRLVVAPQPLSKQAVCCVLSEVVCTRVSRQLLNHPTICLRSGWQSARWVVYYSRNLVLICGVCWIDFQGLEHFFQFRQFAGLTSSCVLPANSHSSAL